MQKKVMRKSQLNKLLLLVAVVAMPFALNGCAGVLLAGAASATTATVAQDSRSLSYMVYDEKIEQDSYAILQSNKLLTKPDDLRITITSFNGNVLVTGQTINRDYLKWVVHEIEKVEHVRKVYNCATLQKPVPPSVISSDALITSKVKTQLLFGKDINSNRFKVVTENGHVYLMGLVTRDESRRAVNTVKQISNVREVRVIFDYIEVKDEKGNAARTKENIVVTPVKTNEKGSSTYHRSAVSSTYVPPVQNKQNGGAFIVDENQSAPVSGVSSNAGSDLLAPSSQY